MYIRDYYPKKKGVFPVEDMGVNDYWRWQHSWQMWMVNNNNAPAAAGALLLSRGVNGSLCVVHSQSGKQQ
jgi:hypothetical protein